MCVFVGFRSAEPSASLNSTQKKSPFVAIAVFVLSIIYVLHEFSRVAIKTRQKIGLFILCYCLIFNDDVKLLF